MCVHKPKLTLYFVIRQPRQSSVFCYETGSEIKTYSTQAIFPIIKYGVRPNYDGIAPELLRFLRGMGKITLTVALDCLRDEDIFLVWNATYVLGEFGDDQAAAGLGDLLEDLLSRPVFGVIEHQVCQTAIQSLGQLGIAGGQVLFKLLPIMTIPDYRERAVRSLGKINPPEPHYREFFLGLLNDSNINIRKSAIKGLGNFNDSDTLTLLLDLVDNPDIGIKKAALASLGNFSKHTKVIEKFQENVTHSDPGIRVTVIEILSKLNSKEFFDLFIKAANDKHPNVRSRAVEQLGKFNDERAIPTILAALANEFSSVRYEALWALERLGSQQNLAKTRIALEAFVNIEKEEKLRQKALNMLHNLTKIKK